MRTTLTVALIAFIFCGGSALPDSRPTLLGDVEGEWVVESWTGRKRDGSPFADLIKTVVSIGDDQITWVESHGTDAQGQTNWDRVSRRLVPRPEVSPNAVDLVPGPKYKAWSRLGIIRRVGDELQLCVKFGQRPSSFERRNDGSEHVVLRRVHNLDK